MAKCLTSVVLLMLFINITKAGLQRQTEHHTGHMHNVHGHHIHHNHGPTDLNKNPFGFNQNVHMPWPIDSNDNIAGYSDNMQYPRDDATSYKPQKMQFPRETPTSKRPKNCSSREQTTKLPKEARNCAFGFCDEAPTYPKEKIRELISKSSELQYYFKQPTFIAFDINNRGGFENTDTETLCKSVPTRRTPQYALNLNKINRTVVNDENYTQELIQEICFGAEEGKVHSCKYSQFFPNGIVSKCQQRYTKTRLHVYDDTKNKIVLDVFDYPSFCVCTVENMTIVRLN